MNKGNFPTISTIQIPLSFQANIVDLIFQTKNSHINHLSKLKYQMVSPPGGKDIKYRI